MPNQESSTNGDASASIADQLRRESDRLRQLAEDLKAREMSRAEMESNYPHFKQAIYAALREQFQNELPPLPDKDLETLAAEEGAQPLESFIRDLDQEQEPPR
jgi:hypothetical protein